MYFIVTINFFHFIGLIFISFYWRILRFPEAPAGGASALLTELPSSIGVKATAVTEAEAEHLPHTPPEPADGGTAKLNTVKARHKVSHKKWSLSRYREIYMFNSLRTFHGSYISLWLKRQPLNFLLRVNVWWTRASRSVNRYETKRMDAVGENANC